MVYPFSEEEYRRDISALKNNNAARIDNELVSVRAIILYLVFQQLRYVTIFLKSSDKLHIFSRKRDNLLSFV